MTMLSLSRIKLVLAAVVAGFAVTSLVAYAQSGSGAGFRAFERSTLSIVSGSASHQFTVELALTARQHAQGLMFRRRMARDAGMLFIYRRPEPVQMWMKNTLIPLDMLFIDGNGGIVRIAERAVPHSLETIAAGVPVKGVLEVNGGVVSRLKIRIGDRIVHSAFRNTE